MQCETEQQPRHIREILEMVLSKYRQSEKSALTATRVRTRPSSTFRTAQKNALTD